MNELSYRDQLVKKLEMDLVQLEISGAIMELGFAVQNELDKINGRELTEVEAEIQKIVKNAIKKLVQK